MRQGIVVIIVYQLKLRVILRRAAKCLRPSDKLSSIPPVMIELIIRANDINNFLYFSYFSKSSLRLFVTFILFRLSIILFISFFAKNIFKFMFSSPNFFSLKYASQQSGQFSYFVSLFLYFLAISSLPIGNSFCNHIRWASFYLL